MWSRLPRILLLLGFALGASVLQAGHPCLAAADSGETYQADQDVADDWIGYAKNPQRTGYVPYRIAPPLVSRWKVTAPVGFFIGAPHVPAWNGRPEDARLRSAMGQLAARVTTRGKIGNYGNGVYIKYWDGFSGAALPRQDGGGSSYAWTAWHSSLTHDGLSIYGGYEHGGSIEFADQFGKFFRPAPCNAERSGPREITVYDGLYFNMGYFFPGSPAQSFHGQTDGTRCTGAGTFDSVAGATVWKHEYSFVNNVLTFVNGVLLEYKSDEPAPVPGSSGKYLKKVDSLAAFQANTGKPLWEKNGVTYASGSGEHVFFVDASGVNAYKAEATTGAIAWTSRIDSGGSLTDSTAGSFPVVGSTAVVINGKDRLVGLDKVTGRRLWSYAMPGHASALVLSDTVLYFIKPQRAGSSAAGNNPRVGNLVAVDVATGAELMDLAGYFSDVIVANKMLYVVGQSGLDSGATKYIEAFTGAGPTPRVNGNQAVLRCESGKPLRLDGEGSLAAEGKSITRYGWHLGDGTELEGATASHAFAPVQNLTRYPATLTVTDSGGAVARHEFQVEVTPRDSSSELAELDNHFQSLLARDRAGRLLVAYHDDGYLVLRSSADGGGSWSAPKKLAKGVYPNSIATDPQSDTVYLAGVNSELSLKYVLVAVSYQEGSWRAGTPTVIADSLDTQYQRVKYRKIRITPDKEGRLWGCYSKGKQSYQSELFCNSGTGGAPWNSELGLGINAGPGEMFLYGGRPAVAYSRPTQGDDQARYSHYHAFSYWDGARFVETSPAPKPFTLYGRPEASFLANPADGSVSMLYNARTAYQFWVKDALPAGGWQRKSSKVVPTHATLPDNRFPGLASDGDRTYLVWADWQRRDNDGYHFNIALRACDRNGAWDRTTTPVLQQSAVIEELTVLKDSRGLGYLPITFQEKTPQGKYSLRFIAPTLSINRSKMN